MQPKRWPQGSMRSWGTNHYIICSPCLWRAELQACCCRNSGSNNGFKFGSDAGVPRATWITARKSNLWFPGSLIIWAAVKIVIGLGGGSRLRACVASSWLLALCQSLIFFHVVSLLECYLQLCYFLHWLNLSTLLLCDT